MSDRYDIKAKIAEGGLGAVYVAHDRNLDREVALKRVLPEALGEDKNAAIDLIKEARVLSALQHPNIVTVYDVGQDARGPYVVMELLKGETLDKTIKRGALPKSDFEQLVSQCLEGLVAAQAVGLVHRDLKPANIMVIWHATGKFQLKILDFGLAKLSKHPSKQTIDQYDSIMGSIYFMAPEQFERTPLDGRTDLYAMAAIFYYCLTTHYPFQGETAYEVMGSHLTHKYTPLEKLRPDLPEWIASWLDWLMDRQAKHRPVDAKEALAFFRKESFRNKAEREAFAAENEEKVAAAKAAAGESSDAGQEVVKATPSRRLQPPEKKTENTAQGRPSGKPVAAIPVADEDDDGVQVAEVVVDDDEDLTGATAVILEDEASSSGPVLATGADKEHAISIEGFVVEEGDEAAKKPKIPKWLFITLPLILLGGGIPAVMNLVDRKAHNTRIERITEMSEADKLEGTVEDVKLLLGFLEGGGHSSEEYGVMAASILARIQGDGVDEAICQGISKARGDGRINLVRVIGMREYSDGVHYVFKELANPKVPTHLSAWNTLGLIARSSDVPAMIAALDAIRTGDDAKDSKQRMFAKEAIISVCESIANEEQRAKEVLQAIKQVSNEETQKALLQIAGRLSTQQVRNRLRALLRDKTLAIQAARAIGEWKNTEPMEDLLEFLKTAKNDGEKLVALQSLAAINMRPSSRAHAKTIALLAEASKYVPPKRSREKNTLLAAMALLPDRTAKPTIEKIGGAAFKSLLPTYLKENAKALQGVVKVNGPTNVGADKALILGEGARLSGGIVTNWSGADSSLKWEVAISKAGRYKVIVEQGSEAKKPGSYRLMVADLNVEITPKNTGSKSTFEEVNVGTCKFPEAGNYSIWIQPIKMPDDGAWLMDLKSLKLQPK